MKSSSCLQSSKRDFCSRPSVLSDSAETAVIALSAAGRESTSSRIRVLLLSGTGLPRSFGRNLRDTQMLQTSLHPCLLFGFPNFSLKTSPFIWLWLGSSALQSRVRNPSLAHLISPLCELFGETYCPALHVKQHVLLGPKDNCTSIRSISTQPF